MLTHPTIEKLHNLKLTGMVKALTDQQQMFEIDSLGFEERLGLLVDREETERENRKLALRLKRPSSGSQPLLKISTSAAPEGWTRHLS